MRNEMKNKMKNEMKNEMMCCSKRALSAIVDLTSSFLVRAVSIFFNTKDDHETRKMKC
jgi:hypothetical protein